MTPRLGVIAFLLVLLAVPASAEQVPVLSFGTPAQLTGEVEAAGLQWALLYLGGPTDVQLSEIVAGSVVNRTLTMATVRVPEAGRYDAPSTWQPANPVTLPPAFAASLAFASERPSALFLIADSVTITAGPARGQMVRVSAGDDAEAPLASRQNTPASHTRVLDDGGVGLGLLAETTGNAVFHLSAKGVRTVEWFGARVECSGSGECPAGGGTWDLGVGTSRGDAVNTTRRSWMHLTAAGGLLEGSGEAWGLAAGGAATDVRVDGVLRLPRATRESVCPGCTELANSTLSLEGNLTLQSLSPDDMPGRLRSGLEGVPSAARLDEAAVDGAALLGLAPVVVAGAAAVAVAVKLLALFARAVKDPLANPRRKALYDTIRANPGLTFSDLLRLSGLGNGSVFHHVRLLAQRGLIVRHRVGKTIRIFENHGRFDRDWRTVAALRDPQLRLLHAWLKASGPCGQKDVVRTATEWGWSPTATKRRLTALVEAGLLASRREGRLRLYSA